MASRFQIATGDQAETAAMTNPDRAAAGRAFEAMMTMHKIDIAKIAAAVRA